MPSTLRRIAVAVLALSTMAGLAACGGHSSAASGPLSGAKFTVGAKDFSEQDILAAMTADLLKQAGADVQTKELKGSVNTRKALESGDVQLYWEYTGTAWVTYLQHTQPINDPQQQFDAVAKEDAEKNGIAWLPRGEFNNTYALAVRRQKADELHLTTMSDLANAAKSDPSLATICVESEFANRNDGLPGLLKAYGMNVPPSNVKLLDTGVIYNETAKGGACNFGEVFATDGRIKAQNLTVLTDDKHFFPVYQGAPTLKKDTLARYPQIQQILAPLTQKLTTETMRSLNAQVDVDGDDPASVAQDWLKQQGLLS
jgi:osmoprotectant transport system substrate-binding protein